jgi:hypothetical protein
MKKQIALVLTLAAFLISACDDENPVRPRPAPWPPTQTNAKPEPLIYSLHPNAAAPGTTVAILGANFGSEFSDNHVAFGSSAAEITQVAYGVLTVRVPNLPEGDYEINVTCDGQARRAPQMFTITNSQD